MIDFNNNIYLGVASPDMERDLSNYYTKAQTRALVDTKQDIITGAATTITEDNLTAKRAVISNASGKVAVSNVTSTELGYLSGVTSAVQTQLNNKASTSLDNLTADGQMIIDTVDGKISNCVLEIPQNLKLEFSNGTVTLKAGSIITRTGSTYSTVTTTHDVIWSSSTQANVKQYLFITPYGFAVGLYGRCNINKVGSGDTLPANGSTYLTFYDTTDKVIYQWNPDTSQWESTTTCYPLGIIEIDSQGHITGFAKDSNGNDMIFNGAGYIGHHAFVYPNVKALLPIGFNEDGSLKSREVTTNSLQIIELSSQSGKSLCFPGSNQIASLSYTSVKNKDELQKQYIFQYCQETNSTWLWTNNAWIDNAARCQFVKYVYDGTTVTDFTIRQPVRTATVEMLNSALGDVETLLASI